MFVGILNRVTLTGVLQTDFVLEHESFGKKFYMSEIKVARLSGATDVMTLLAEEEQMKQFKSGDRITVSGSFRSFNRTVNGKQRLYLNVLAKEIRLVSKEMPDENSIELYGMVAQKPYARQSSRTKTSITDFQLIAEREHGKSDFIPCIAWNRNAEEAAKLKKGDYVKLEGRIQSRVVPTSDQKKDKGRLVNEVSINHMEIEKRSLMKSLFKK